MSPLISQLLSRWELNSPVFSGPEIRGALQLFLLLLEPRGIVQPTHSSGTWNCSECQEESEVVFVTRKDGTAQATALCRCGPNRISEDQRQRFKLSTPALLATIFGDYRLDLEEMIPGQLWQIGRATWGSRAHNVCFARQCNRSEISKALPILATRPKTILFVPTNKGAERWSSPIECPVLSIESYLDWSENDFVLDGDAITVRIEELMSQWISASKPLNKRASRTAKIELLRKELVEHVRAAFDHAQDTLDRTGQPNLLPRPAQEELARRLEMTTSAVSRCLNDPAANELKLLWKMADNLDEVMRFGRTVSLRA